MIISIYGPVNTGKSTFPFTCPGPLWIADLERGVKRAAWRIAEIAKQLGREIEYETWTTEINADDMLALLTYTRGGAIHGRIEQWSEVTQAFVKAVQSNRFKTMSIDTAKMLWDIDNQSILELRQKDKPDKQTLDPMEYAAPNLRMENIIQICNKMDINLILINHQRDVYHDVVRNGQMRSEPSGRKELDGWSKTTQLSDWVFFTDCDITVQSGMKIKLSDWHENSIPQGEFKFTARIDKSPVGMDLKGRVLEDFSYQTLERLVGLMGRQMV